MRRSRGWQVGFCVNFKKKVYVFAWSQVFRSREYERMWGPRRVEYHFDQLFNIIWCLLPERLQSTGLGPMNLFPFCLSQSYQYTPWSSLISWRSVYFAEWHDAFFQTPYSCRLLILDQQAMLLPHPISYKKFSMGYLSCVQNSSCQGCSLWYLWRYSFGCGCSVW